MIDLILASNSATRRALLERAGVSVQTLSPGVDEDALKAGMRAEGASARDTAILLAELKAVSVSRRRPEALVIGADQMLECAGVWYDKPVGVDGVRAQLRALRGQTHSLPTAVVVARGGQRIWSVMETPCLTMRRFSDTLLERYLAAVGESVCHSVGGYQIEGRGLQLFERITGGQDAIMGLPLLPLLQFLREWGVLEQ